MFTLKINGETDGGIYFSFSPNDIRKYYIKSKAKETGEEHSKKTGKYRDSFFVFDI